MKIIKQYLLPIFTLTFFGLSGMAQNQQPLEKSLLWEISGNGLSKPSYLFGTVHMICKDDAALGDSLTSIINEVDRVYFEVDMDNLVEMLSALKLFKMRNDTSLADLLSKEDYEKVKSYMERKSSMLPFSQLEKYKPLLASSMMMESGMGCGATVAMEQLIMEEAKNQRKRIEGLETLAFQASIFDSIPYKVQAKQLLKYIDEEGGTSVADKEFEKLMQAYKDQDIEKLGETLNANEDGMDQYMDLLLNNRNRNWVVKLKTLLYERSILIAVGAGHLAGEKGVIRLLRKEGFTVRPVKNIVELKRVI